MSTFTLTSPTTGGLLPAGFTQVGGLVRDLVGVNGARVVTELSADKLFEGYFSSSPGVIGTQTGFSASVLTALGGGLKDAAIRVTLYDGDNAKSEFDFHDNSLTVNG